MGCRRLLRGTIRGYVVNWQLYLFLLLPMLWLLVFRYLPMYGAQIAFRRYNVVKGIWESPWTGFVHFRRFFSSHMFLRVLGNTLGISFHALVFTFPAPIILALMLNYAIHPRFKKFIQMVSYAPHFISTVVMVGLIIEFLSMRGGLINNIITLFGGEPVNFMGTPAFFNEIYSFSLVWQNTGYSTIVYLAALSSVDANLHEAAIVDGATKLQRIWHIDIVGMLPTAVVLLILRTGRIMNLGFEMILLMQNPLNLKASEIIQTYVYKVGLASEVVNFSYATAIGLFQSIINLIVIIFVNQIARRLNETSLW